MSNNCGIGEFMQRLAVRTTSSVTAQIGASAIARYRGGPGDAPRTALSKHILTMSVGMPARFEGRGERGRRLLYTKSPGALSLVPAGICPLLRSQADFELVICTLDSSLVESIETELEVKLEGDLRLRVNVQDHATQQLLKLLLTATEEAGALDRLYVDHLSHALAIRFLILAKSAGANVTGKASAALPHHIMRRIEERMRNLESDLSLEALAKESRYSPTHFIRMFHVATGQTPHNYVLHLRVERARQLLANSRLSLTEIALECGFSSHSHMTRVFHQLLGVTPSTYRRTS
jgi:AraC family transcriptional regulator